MIVHKNMNRKAPKYTTPPASKSLQAAAFQQTLLQDLGLAKRKVIRKRVSPKKFLDLNSKQLTTKHNSPETIIRKSLLLKKNSPLLADLVKTLTEVLKTETKTTTIEIKPIRNLSEILSNINIKPETTLELPELLKLAETRKNTKCCPICLENFSPNYKSDFIIVDCCAQVFHSKCLTSLLRLANLSRKQGNNDDFHATAYSRASLVESSSSLRGSSLRGSNMRCSTCPVCRQPFSSKVVSPSIDFRFEILKKSIVLIQKSWKGYICRAKNESGLKNLATSRSRLKRMHKLKLRNQKDFFDEMDSEMDKQKNLLNQFEQLYLDWKNIRAIAIENNRHLECAVCMEPIEQQHRVSLLSCSHVYHEKCLNSWIVYKNGVEECPLCRQSFFTKDFHF